jgi:hypothetical protein
MFKQIYLVGMKDTGWQPEVCRQGRVGKKANNDNRNVM